MPPKTTIAQTVAALVAAPSLIASGLIPELCATYRKKNPSCPFSEAQLDFVARCALNPMLALSAHEESPTFNGKVVGVFLRNHPHHPEQFAICFRDSPEHFTKFINFVRSNSPDKRRTDGRRARLAAGALAVKEQSENDRLPTADEIVAASNRPYVSARSAEAARTVIAKRLKARKP
jgi:hypothetical protein